MKPQHAGLAFLSVVLSVNQSGILWANDDVPKSDSAKATTTEEVSRLGDVRKLLAADPRWTRLYTYDADVQKTVGKAVKWGKVISPVQRAGFDPMTYLLFEPVNFNGSGVLWIDGAGLSHLCEADRKPDDVKPSPAVRSLLDNSYAVLSVDLPSRAKPRAGESKAEDSLLALRVRATLAAIAAALPVTYQLDIVGTGDAGPVVLIASAFLTELSPSDRKKIRYVMADLRGATGDTTEKPESIFFLQGANKFGGIPGIAALNGTQKLMVAGTAAFPSAELEVLQKPYLGSENSDSLKLIEESLSDKLLVNLVTGKSQK